MKAKVFQIRRWILQRVIPEWFWPESVEMDNINVRLRGAPYSYGIKRLLKYESDRYEDAERMLCRSAIKPGDHVLEMGGSIGILGRIIAELAGDTGKVISIEADHALAAHVQSEYASETFTMIHGYAFPVYSEVSLDIAFDNSGGSLGGRVAYTHTNGNAADNVLFLSTIERKLDFRPNVLVVDIEGAENIMCEYSPQLPSSIRTLIIELHPGIYGFQMMTNIVRIIQQEGFILSMSIGQSYLFTRE